MTSFSRIFSFTMIILSSLLFSSNAYASPAYESHCKSLGGYIVELEFEEPEGSSRVQCMILDPKTGFWIGHLMNARGEVMQQPLTPEELNRVRADAEELERLILQDEADRKNNQRYDPIMEVQRGRLR